MKETRLVRPSAAYAAQIAEFRREFLMAGSSMDGCSPLRRTEDPDEFVKSIEAQEDETTMMLVRVSDDRLLGMIQIRHHFNDYLEKFGGHIGYSIRPSERKKGYAKQMLGMGLELCRQIGLRRVLVTCVDGNTGSEKTILANGGVYESTVLEPNVGLDVKRFWIDLAEAAIG